jgi:4-hydroxyphenylpyruvate dioxygenase
MGPFPHDAPPAAITPQNPMGTDGFAFVEFAHPEPLQLHRLFRLMGFAEVARHRSKAITVYRQGDVDYLVNEEPNTHAARFAALHGPCAASMGFRVVDAAHVYERALSSVLRQQTRIRALECSRCRQSRALVAAFSI